MAKSKKVVSKIKKFSSFRDAYDRANTGDKNVQKCIIGCLSNLGCEHLGNMHKRHQPVKWKAYYSGLDRYISALVGECFTTETKAEKEVLAELNFARTYYTSVKDEELEWEQPKTDLIPMPIAPEGDHE